MKNVLILGSGLVARPMIHHLLKQGFRVTVASNTPDRAAGMITGFTGGASLSWEANDEEALDRMVAGHDLTVSLLPWTFHPLVARYCLKHRKHLVTTSYVKPEMKALDEPARKAGVLFLNEVGLDPGIDHMSAMQIIDAVHREGGAVLEFYSICGALPAPEVSSNPFRYKFSWSPKGVIMASNNDATFLRHGKETYIPSSDLFRSPFTIDFPGAGMLEVYPNRDSLAYRDLYCIPETQTLFRGTFRYKGWCELLDQMKQLGLLSYDTLDMTGMTFTDLLSHQLKRSPVNLIAGSPCYNALKWLGFFETIPMNRETDSPFEVTSDLMIRKMSMHEDERDMVVMQHTFLAGYPDGHREVIRSRMLDFGIPGGDTAVARTVSLPAALCVELILGDQWRLTGVHIPVIPEIYQPVLARLSTLGITMQEEFQLPLSANIK
jgi:saccharopine dehydrogenase-like NADP-dependent oxidoreductase